MLSRSRRPLGALNPFDRREVAEIISDHFLEPIIVLESGLEYERRNPCQLFHGDLRGVLDERRDQGQMSVADVALEQRGQRPHPDPMLPSFAMNVVQCHRP